MRTLAIIGLIFSVMSCTSHSPMSEKELYDYIHNDENGLIEKKDVGGFQLVMLWKSNDLIAQQQIQKGTKKEFDSLRNYFSKYLYFTLQMTYNGKDLESKFGTDPATFPEKISFLSYGLSQNIELRTATKTVPALECLYSRSYGIGASQCLIVFEKPTSDLLEIFVNGAPLGFGKQMFSFKLSDINNAPQLKI